MPLEIVTEQQVHDAVDFLNHGSRDHAEAKADRVKAEHMLKHVKALVMKQCIVGMPVSGQEREALASDAYKEQIQKLWSATVREETIRADRENERLKVEIWRTQSANLRGPRL